MLYPARIAAPRLLCFAFALMTSLTGSLVPSSKAQTAAKDPIPEIGRMMDIPGAHELPDPQLDYKIVFDLNSASDNLDEVNPGLQTVAALVNTFAHYGVERSQRHFVVIFHGKTVDLVVNNEAYRGRHPGHANPNVKLMQQLTAAGVQLVVCGQSAVHAGLDLKTMQPEVQLNLSATVTLMNLMTRGYVRLDE